MVWKKDKSYVLLQTKKKEETKSLNGLQKKKAKSNKNSISKKEKHILNKINLNYLFILFIFLLASSESKFDGLNKSKYFSL